jgi:hypothetical protein
MGAGCKGRGLIGRGSGCVGCERMRRCGFAATGGVNAFHLGTARFGIERLAGGELDGGAGGKRDFPETGT